MKSFSFRLFTDELGQRVAVTRFRGSSVRIVYPLGIHPSVAVAFRDLLDAVSGIGFVDVQSPVSHCYYSVGGFACR